MSVYRPMFPPLGKGGKQTMPGRFMMRSGLVAVAAAGSMALVP